MADEQAQTPEETGPKVATTRPVPRLSTVNKVLVLVAVLVGVALIGQLVSQYGFRDTISTKPIPQTTASINITIPPMYRGNPYTSNEPFNIMAFYASMEVFQELGGQTLGSFTRTDSGKVQDITIDSTNQTLSFTIQDDQNRLLRYKYTPPAYHRIRVVDTAGTTIPLNTIAPGDTVAISTTHSTTVSTYEQSVLEVLIEKK